MTHPSDASPLAPPVPPADYPLGAAGSTCATRTWQSQPPRAASARRPRGGSVWRMAGEAASGELQRAGRVALADELYGLRCALAAAEYGEPPFLTAVQHARMQARVAELEPVVGDELDALLAAED
jgi:hypothetical protein